MYNKILWR